MSITALCTEYKTWISRAHSKYSADTNGVCAQAFAAGGIHCRMWYGYSGQPYMASAMRGRCRSASSFFMDCHIDQHHLLRHHAPRPAVAIRARPPLLEVVQDAKDRRHLQSAEGCVSPWYRVHLTLTCARRLQGWQLALWIVLPLSSAPSEAKAVIAGASMQLVCAAALRHLEHLN